MAKFLPKIIILMIISTGVLAIVGFPAYADEPKAVHLANFNVTPLDNAVRIDWETGSESGTAGFMIKRSANGNEQYLDYVGDNGFIEGEGGVAVGYNYSVTDNQVQNGDVHTYILIEIENNSNEVELARETVNVGIPPTSTRAVISDNNSNPPTATPRSSTQATATVMPTATTKPESNNAAAAPTNTPPSFVTITRRATEPAPTATQRPVENLSNIDNSEQTDLARNTPDEESTIGLNITGASEVLAQAELVETATPMGALADLSAPQAQDDYPDTTSAETAVPIEEYPNEPTADNLTPPSVPVIGNSQGYTQQTTTANTTEGTSSSNTNVIQSNLFLWIGFVVAMLIFAIGLIGSILLFTRKAN